MSKKLAVRLGVKLLKAENLNTSNASEPIVTFKLSGMTKSTTKGKASLTGQTWTWKGEAHEFTKFEPKNNLLQIIVSDQNGTQIGVTYIHLSSLPKTMSTKPRVNP
jgi:hypothetical protein